MRGWLICPVIGDGTEGNPFRASVADREATDGDRLEFVIGDGESTCLVAFDVVDPSNFGGLGGEIISYEDELDA
jgi:hypothetical protein